MSAAWLSGCSDRPTLDRDKITADNYKLKGSEIRTLGTAQWRLQFISHGASFTT